MTKIKVGPILGLESDTLYTLCFSTDKAIKKATANVDGGDIACVKMGETPSSIVWRAEYKIRSAKKDRPISYRIHLDGSLAECANKRSEWSFFIPGTESTPKLAYASCNGFSEEKLMAKTQDPYQLWQRMAAQHQKAPFSLLLMGGDQLYADSVFSSRSVESLRRWKELSHKKKVGSKSSKTLIDQLDRFYDRLYQERWLDESLSLMLASIPSVMMWDDHDIFDGWGSYPDDLQNCEVFQSIFAAAKRYFELFQVRSRHNKSLLKADASHYAMAFRFRDYNILALDNRAERTLKAVMSDDQWALVGHHLKERVKDGHLLVMSAVPVVYRDFSFADSGFEATPWEEELTDDLKDHWRAKEHEGERAKLIHHLLENACSRKKESVDYKTVILSGDVHIGSIGVIHDRARECKVHQVVSSGIVHPAPSRLQWMGIMAVTNDRDEYLDESEKIQISMLKPFASDKYIRHRNFVTLDVGTDRKLWVNWVSEGKDAPCYPIM